MTERNCPNCGATLVGQTYTCQYCGTDWTPAKAKTYTPPQDSRIARLAFAVSMLSLPAVALSWAGLFAGLTGACIGRYAIKRIRCDPATFVGEGIALAAMIIGTITTSGGLVSLITKLVQA